MSTSWSRALVTNFLSKFLLHRNLELRWTETDGQRTDVWTEGRLEGKDCDVVSDTKSRPSSKQETPRRPLQASVKTKSVDLFILTLDHLPPVPNTICRVLCVLSGDVAS